MMRLSQDFKEFLQFLNDNDVRYLVIGGYAVALHGHPRYTKDLDVWIECESGNAERLVRALEAFGFGALQLTPQDFMEKDQVVQLGYPPHRIDILSFAEGLEFSQCYSQRVDTCIDGITIHFLDLESLKKNKRAAGRLQDLADVENLE
jgi:hypothetical protein